MPHVLDRASTYQKKSHELALASLRSFAEQCRRGFVEARSIRFPRSYRKIKEVVVCGMGGSTLGTHVIHSVFRKSLGVPLTIVNNYQIPGSVDKQSLVLLSSYSGNTEETTAAAHQARKCSALITGLTTGGKLEGFFRRNHSPWYRIDGAANPSGQPRMGLGYLTMGQLGILAALGYIRVSKSQVDAVVRKIQERSAELDPEAPATKNVAKRLAAKLLDRVVILISAEHLVGSAHAFTNQLNETAKAFATWFALPELNHHLLEGLRFPKALRHATSVFVESSRYSTRIAQRLNITREIVERRGVHTIRIEAQARDRLSEAFDLLTLGGFVSFYLSVLHKVNPLTIPTVDELKRRLARS